MKALLHSAGKVISEDFAGSILATQTQPKQLYEQFKTGFSLIVTDLEKTYSQRKV